MKKYCVLLVATLLVAVCVAGCGPKVTKTEGVTGTIKLDGQPQADVNVYFVPVDAGGSNGYAKTDENGFYKLQTLTGAAEAGTTPGKYKVKFDYQIREDDGTMMENGEEIPKYKSVSGLAKKWNNEETSGVEVEVVPGDNTFDFEITSK